MSAYYREYSHILYHLFEHTKRHTVQEVTDDHLKSSALYKYLEGELTCPPEVIRKLLIKTGDVEFIDYFVRDTKWIIVPRPQTVDSVRTIEREALDVSAAVGKLHADLDKSLDNGKLTELERRHLDKTIDHIQREAEEVRIKLHRKVS